MDQIKFTEKDMEKFNDKIQNCLEDEGCLKIFQHYLEISDKPVLINALRLWIEANKTDSFVCFSISSKKCKDLMISLCRLFGMGNKN